MNKVQTKPNDIFIATFNAPEATPLELLKSNITASNTSFLNKEEYKSTPFVKRHFTDEKGIFQEEEFNKVYEQAQEKYLDLSDQMSYEGLVQYIEYDPDNIYKPANARIKDTTPVFKNISKENPLAQQMGIEGIGITSESVYTEKERAQQHAVWDTKNKKWLDYTAEDQSLIKKLFGKTLKYAKYQQTGEQLNPVTGKIEYHEKGEWMTDEDGQFFTATMDGQQKGFDEVVAVADILTKESSKINKFDFWDSDGMDKSLGGIAMKTFFSLLPYLTPLRGYYGAFTGLMSLVGTMPILYKSFESLILGENQTNMTDSMLALENWFYKWDSNASKSKKGSKSFWTVESIGQLVADTFGQLYQQRAAAKLAPKILKRFDTRLGKVAKYNEMTAAGTSADEAARLLGLTARDIVSGGKELNKVAATFSTAYMGIVHTSDMYNQTLNAGYDRRVAGLTALASMSALFGIMKFNAGRNGLGTWFLDKTTGFNEHLSTGAVQKVAFAELKVLQEALRKAVSQGDKKAMAYAIREWKRKGAEALHQAFVIGGEDIWKGMIVEGVEEVTEEVVQDTIKGIVDTMQWLGWTSTPEATFGGWKNVFSKQGLERYLATFAGGAIGGGIFKAQDKWINPFVDQVFTAEPISKTKEDIYNMTRIIVDGRFDEYIKALDKGKKYMHNALDSSTLGNGEMIGTKQESQADVLVKLAKAKAYSIKALLEASVGNFGTLTDFQKQAVAHHMAEVLEGYNFASDYLNDQFADAAATVAELTEVYNGLKEIESPTEVQKNELTEAKEKLQQAVDHFKNFFTGANFNMSMIEGKLLSRPDLIRGLLYTDIEDYAADIFGVKYSELSNTDPLKSEISDRFTELKKDITKENLKQTLPNVSKVLVKLLEKTGEHLKQFSQSSEAKQVLGYIEGIQNKDHLTVNKLIDRILAEEATLGANDEELQVIREILLESSIDDSIYTLAKVSPELFSIQAKHFFDLYSKIKSNLELIGINEEQEKILQEMINDTAMHSNVQQWTPKHILKLINQINDALANPTNPWGRTIQQYASEGETEIPQIRVKNNGNSLNTDIKTGTTSSLLDFISDGNIPVIDSELRDRLLNLAISISKPLGDQDAKIANILQSNSLTPVQKLEQIFTNPDFDFEGDDTYDFVKKLYETIISKQVVQNPLVQALKSFYKYINGSSRGQDIFDWIDAKNNNYAKTSSGIDRELTEVDIATIKNAQRAISVLATVINAATETKFSQSVTGSIIPTGGIIEYAREYARFMKLDTNQFWTMSFEDAQTALRYLTDLSQRLEDFQVLDRARKISKYGADKKLRTETTIGFANALLKKELKIGDITIVGRTDIPDEEKACEVQIEKRLDEIRQAYLAWTKLDSANTIEEFITLLKDQFELKETYHQNLASKLFPWNLDTKTFEAGGYDEMYLFKRIVQTAIVDRTQIQKDIKDILSVNDINIYPKFDQQLALEELLYMAYDLKNQSNVMNSLLSAFNNNRPLLYNTTSLLGIAGSGKSFVLIIAKKKLQEILNNVDFVSVSATEKNLTDMKSRLNINGDLIKPFLESLKTGLGETAEIINNTFIEIATEWYNTLDQSTSEKHGKEYIEEITAEFKQKLATSASLKNITVNILTDQKRQMEFIIPVAGGGSVTLVSQFTTSETNWEAKSDLRYAVQNISDSILKGVILNNNIIADEITLQTPIQLYLLATLAKQNNKALITAGDYRQQAFLAKIGDIHSNFSPLLVYSYLSAPAFVGSYRFSNNLTTDNLNAIIEVIADSESGIIPVRQETFYASSTLEGLKTKLSQAPLAWQVIQQQNNKLFIGHKIDSDSDVFKADLNTLILNNIQGDQTLAIITENAEDRKAIKDLLSSSNKIDMESQVTYIDANNVQGGEYDYVIVYGVSGYKTKYPRKQELVDDGELNIPKAYTLLSRSMLGTLVYDSPNGLFKSTGIASNSEPSIDGELYEESDNQETQSRISEIDGILRQLFTSSSTTPTPHGTGNGGGSTKPTPPVKPTKPSTKPNADDMQPGEVFDDSKHAKFYGFNNASILQTWYNRVGINYSALSKPISSHVLGSMPVDGFEDLEAFINAGLVPRGVNTLMEAADALMMYKLEILIDLCDPTSKWYQNEHHSPKLRYKRIDANPDIDYAYRKINDLTDWSRDNIFKLIQIEVSDGNWITLGKLGYNLMEDKSNASITEESLFTQNQTVEFYLTGQESSEMSDYINTRSVHFATMLQQVGVPGFIRQTNLRDAWVDSDNPLNWDKDHADLRIEDVKFNRILLEHLLRQGYRIDDIWDPNVRTDPEEFKQWYRKYNYFTPSSWDQVIAAKELHRQVWIGVHLGTHPNKRQFTKPIMLNRIYEGNFLNDTPDNVVTNHGHITRWAARQLGRFVIDLVKSHLPSSEEREKFKDFLYNTPSVSDRIAALEKNEVLRQAFVAAVNEVNSSILDEDIISDLNSLIDLLIPTTKKDNESPKEDNRKLSLFTSNQSLMALTGSKLGMNYFYMKISGETTINTLQSESTKWVATRFIESMNFFINWDFTTITGLGTPLMDPVLAFLKSALVDLGVDTEEDIKQKVENEVLPLANKLINSSISDVNFFATYIANNNISAPYSLLVQTNQIFEELKSKIAAAQNSDDLANIEKEINKIGNVFIQAITDLTSQLQEARNNLSSQDTKLEEGLKQIESEINGWAHKDVLHKLVSYLMENKDAQYLSNQYNKKLIYDFLMTHAKSTWEFKRTFTSTIIQYTDGIFDYIIGQFTDAEQRKEASNVLNEIKNLIKECL